MTVNTRLQFRFKILMDFLLVTFDGISHYKMLVDYKPHPILFAAVKQDISHSTLYATPIQTSTDTGRLFLQIYKIHMSSFCRIRREKKRV